MLSPHNNQTSIGPQPISEKHFHSTHHSVNSSAITTTNNPLMFHVRINHKNGTEIHKEIHINWPRLRTMRYSIPKEVLTYIYIYSTLRTQFSYNITVYVLHFNTPALQQPQHYKPFPHFN